MTVRPTVDWTHPPTPLYYQIALVLRNHLGTTWKAGDLLPAEQDLAREFDVSVGTMRRAIQMLVDEGHVSRHQGRGTIVLQPAPRVNSPRLTGSLVDLMQFEPDSRVRLLSRRRLVPPPEVRLSLGLGDSDEATMFRRLVSVRGRVLAYLESFVPGAFDADLPTAELARAPLVSLLERFCGVRMGRCEQSIGAHVAGATAAKLLRVPLGFPILHIARTYHDARGRGVLVSSGEYRADLYRCTVTLEPEQL
ncbi:MAG TPA: GntR family transcriptional regulator [Thermodesulfobacteriota bacterium]